MGICSCARKIPSSVCPKRVPLANCFSSIPKDGPEVPWTPLQQLIETEAPDVMYLFDCAYLVPTRFNVDTKGHRRDFLAASRIHQRVHLFSPENSFTRRVSRILRDYAEQGKDITTYMIYTNLVIRGKHFKILEAYHFGLPQHRRVNY